MYHMVVRSKLRRAFECINRGEWAPILAGFAPVHRHVFYGEHALGGTRTSMVTTSRWYERLKKMFPDLAFEVRSIVVTGWPWKTRAIVEWTDRFTLPDGERGSNQGVHAFELAWGKVKQLEIHCDTARLQSYCARMAASGLTEAMADPITG